MHPALFPYVAKETLLNTKVSLLEDKQLLYSVLIYQDWNEKPAQGALHVLSSSHVPTIFPSLLLFAPISACSPGGAESPPALGSGFVFEHSSGWAEGR